MTCVRLTVFGASLSHLVQGDLEKTLLSEGQEYRPRVRKDSSNKDVLLSSWTYCDGGASLSGGDHVSTQRLRRVHTLEHFLLDEMHRKGKLFPGQLADLPGVC